VERISVELEAWMPMQSEVAQASVKSCPLYMAPQMVIVDPVLGVDWPRETNGLITD